MLKMSDDEIIKEIFQILEVEILKRDLGNSGVGELKYRLSELIKSLPDGAKKDKVVEKIKNKQRFCYYINNTGILDFTGYGKNFW